MIPAPLQQLIDQLPEESRGVVAAVVLYYESENRQLKERVGYLEAQLKQNSKNSHKPPSSDGFKKPKRTRSLRKKSDRKPGGQAGHPGSKLKRSDDIDQFVFHPVNQCKCCGKDLKGVEVLAYVKRQVFDLPDLSLDVIEHQAELKQCSCGVLSQGVFPADVRGEVQYGPGIRGLATYLQNYQLLPYQRSAQLLRDVFDVSISEGTLYKISEQAYDHLEDFECQLKQYLIKQDLLHSDETGMNVGGKTHWLHTTGNEQYTHYQVHSKRGYEAMNNIGILPFFKGTLVHDCLRSYFRYEQAEHSVCLAHILRELQAQVEQKQDWAEQMLQLILALKKSKDRVIELILYLPGTTTILENASEPRHRIYYDAWKRMNQKFFDSIPTSMFHSIITWPKET